MYAKRCLTFNCATEKHKPLSSGVNVTSRGHFWKCRQAQPICASQNPILKTLTRGVGWEGKGCLSTRVSVLEVAEGCPMIVGPS